MNSTAIGLPTFAEVVSSILRAPVRVQTHRDDGRALRVLRARVDELVAGRDDVAAQQDTAGRPSSSCSSSPSGARPRRSASTASCVSVDEVELERGRRAEHAFRLVGILHARQLDENPVEALPLHDGLGDADRVHAIAQRQRVLLDREVLPLA